MQTISDSSKKKLNELISISKLPISFCNSSLAYSCFPFLDIDNQYVYRDASVVLILEIKSDYVSLLYVNDNNLLYLYGKTDDSELKIVREGSNYASYVDVKNNSIKIIKSNTLTFEINEILKQYKIKANMKKSNSIDYTELDFQLPRLIEQGSSNANLDQYIPISKLISIKDRDGILLETFGDSHRKLYQEYTFRLTPTLLSPGILPHFKEIGENKVSETQINPSITYSVSTSLKPLRDSRARELYKTIIENEENSELSKIYVRYYDDVIYAISYFQNKIPNLFYIFEDDLKKLQYK